MVRKLNDQHLLLALARLQSDCDDADTYFELTKDIATIVAKYGGGKYTGQTRTEMGTLAHIKMTKDVPNNEGIYAGSPFVQELGPPLKEDTEEWPCYSCDVKTDKVYEKGICPECAK